MPRRGKAMESLKRKPEMVEVILTERNAHPTIVEAADTVTEMLQVKHATEGRDGGAGDRVLSTQYLVKP
jgi:ATP:corrinoid adenosyltransferase